jgi:hypothetical protein
MSTSSFATNEPDAQNRGETEPSETPGDRMVRLAVALRRLGVSEHVTRDLLLGFSADRIEQQLIWLQFRRPKRRSSLVVAAIKGDYEKPAALIEAEIGDSNVSG